MRNRQGDDRSTRGGAGGQGAARSGTVDHRQDERALERLIERCHGVDDVRNALRVGREGRGARV